MSLNNVIPGEVWLEILKYNKDTTRKQRRNDRIVSWRESLSEGYPIWIVTKSTAMFPKLKVYKLLTIISAKAKELKLDDIVLCVIKGVAVLRQIKGIKWDNDKLMFSMGNKRKQNHGWISEDDILGELTGSRDAHFGEVRDFYHV